MATVVKTYAPPYTVYMNWSTGLVVQFDRLLGVEETSEFGVEQVILCRDDRTGDLFIDPSLPPMSNRHFSCSHVSLKKFVEQVNETAGVNLEMGVTFGYPSITWSGDYRSSVANAIAGRPPKKYSLLDSMNRLGSAVDQLTSVINGLI